MFESALTRIEPVDSKDLLQEQYSSWHAQSVVPCGATIYCKSNTRFGKFRVLYLARCGGNYFLSHLLEPDNIETILVVVDTKPFDFQAFFFTCSIRRLLWNSCSDLCQPLCMYRFAFPFPPHCANGGKN